MKLSKPLWSACGAAVLTVGGYTVAPAQVAPASAALSSGVVGHLYVDDNTPVNGVAAFDRHADGSLTPVPGSPFATGGAGTGRGVGSQGALQITPDGRYVLAVNPGSNQISVLRIRPDGALRPVGAPVSSGGVEPVSIAVSPAPGSGQPLSSRGLVYVANAGNGASNYSGFTLNAGGQLSPIPGSTFALPSGSAPGDVLFNGDGTHLVGTRVGTSLIDSFVVLPNGLLVPSQASPFPAQGPGPFGSEFRPTNSAQLFVSNAHGPAGAGTVSAFNDSPAGALTPIGASPFPDFQTAPCWVEISHDGRLLFAVNTPEPSISTYSIAPDGSLGLLATTGFKHPGGLGPEDARLDPEGGSLWVVDTGGDAVSGFAVSSAGLSELASSPTSLPAGAAPFGIVVN
jgi:6-phosphogluconolactonase (cycloisomerase 2 family)